MVATATSSVKGIERDKAISKASLVPDIPLNTIAASNLDAIMSTVISNAPEITPSRGKAARSKEAPTFIKNNGTKNPKPRLDIFSSRAFS